MNIRPPMESPPAPSPAYGPLLDALQKHVVDRTTPALDSALADLDDYLFDRSQNGEEELGLIALREMRRARGQISQKFRQSILDRFRRLRDRRAGDPNASAASSLSLVSDNALEEQLAVEQLAASVLRTHAPAFEVASQRFNVVAAQGELKANEHPLSPAFWAAALGNAMSELEMDDALRIVVFKYFERELIDAIGELYDRCNSVMKTAGILPDLQPTSRSRAPARGQRTPPPQQHEHTPQEYAAAAVAAQAQASTQAPSAAMQISAADQAMFANMLGQLHHWRSAVGMAAPTAPGHDAQPRQGTPVSSNELLSILSLMQHDSPFQFTPAAEGGEQSLASQLRQQMTQSARKLGVEGDNLSLDGLDDDAVDLVALLFDVLLDGPEYDTHIRQKIGRMLVPFVKVAVKDRRMFMYKEHPARKLLNTVADACEGNRGELPQEREILTRVDHTIDRLVAEFNEDVAIFETLEQELRGYMGQHRKRFELAEKRSTEAQRGRERLEQARNTATADLEAHRNARTLPPVIKEFLDRHASHHLVQMALREGSGSPRYEDALQTMDVLLAAFDRASQQLHQDTPLPADGLRAILASAGCTGEAADAALDALHDALARLAGGESALDSDVRMPEQVVLPEAVPLPPEPQPELEVVDGSAGLDYDDDTLSRIRQLQIGDWLQLAGADGHFAPAKVSWVSPISSRLLLVNRRGIRVLVASVHELAMMAKLGRVMLREGGTAFDSAMHQMANRLQSASQVG